MSEQQAEPISGESGSVDPAVLHSQDAAATPAQPAVSPEAAASLEPAIRTEAPDLVPGQNPAEAAEIKLADLQASGPSASDLRASDLKASQAKTPEVHVTKANWSPAAGKLMIMSPGDRTWSNEGSWSNESTWTSEGAAPEAKTEAAGDTSMFGKRRIVAMAAVVALAAVAGAIGGAVATAGFGHGAIAEVPVATNQALDATVARIDADIVALKASVEHTSKMGVSQFNKTSDRLDKLEKAQAEPAAKLAKLSEAVEKLHAAPPPAPVAAAAPTPQPAPKEVTGSVTPQPAAAAPAAPKTEVARLPTVDGWMVRDIGRGGALIEGRQGIFEVYAGDDVPGLGRIDAIRRQDGHWVVVTSRGLIVAR